MSAKCLTAVAHGRQAGKRKSCGGALTVSTSAKDTATTPRLLKKAYCCGQSWPLYRKPRCNDSLPPLEHEQAQHEQTRSRLDDIYTILERLRNHPLGYDDSLVRRLLDCVIVDAKEQITVSLAGGLRVEQRLGRDKSSQKQGVRPFF